MLLSKPCPDIVPATDSSFKVSMSPWSNYTFRVIARNKVGESLPSSHSKTCLTPEDVPYKNPDNVEGRGTAPNNLVIYWTVSVRLYHARFKYSQFFQVVGPCERTQLFLLSYLALIRFWVRFLRLSKISLSRSSMSCRA